MGDWIGDKLADAIQSAAEAGVDLILWFLDTLWAMIQGLPLGLTHLLTAVDWALYFHWVAPQPSAGLHTLQTGRPRRRILPESDVETPEGAVRGVCIKVVGQS